MDSPPTVQEWKTALSATDRYSIIQSISASLSNNLVEAIAIEQAAFQVSSTREEYDTACRPTASPPPHPDVQGSEDGENTDEAGLEIGSYKGCVPIADGVTSQVYRSGDRALKVIVSYHNIEPHNPQREVKILKTLRGPCISLLDVFRDREQQLVLVFPFMPYTLADLIDKQAISAAQVRLIFTDVLNALRDLHAEGIIHRDVKPSAVLLASPDGPAFLSDFGTAWHPEFSAHSEPANNKILDIGTGPYRAPETLFGNVEYRTSVDMWSLGVMLSEAIRTPPKAIFESRPAHEDGSQLGLILSIFKTLGTPTPETWPEANAFKVAPFELWTVFPARPWEEILPDVDAGFKDLVASLLRYDGKRATAEEALQHSCLTKSKTPEMVSGHDKVNAGVVRETPPTLHSVV